MSDKKLFLARYGSVKHINAALDDDDYHFRATAIRNPNANNELDRRKREHHE